jgi:hypothetical protein
MEQHPAFNQGVPGPQSIFLNKTLAGSAVCDGVLSGV